MGTRHHAGSARRRLGCLLAGAFLLLAPAALAAPASAASLSVNKACYVFTKADPATMIVTGAGFVPGDKVTLTTSTGWQNVMMATAGPTGGFAVSLQAPEPKLEPPGQETVTLTAEDFESSTTLPATTSVTVARFGVSAIPVDAPVSHKVTWYLAGFRPSKDIYVHYLHGKPVARMRLGRAKGSCGVLKARARLFPGGHPRYRRYRVQIDNARRYSKHATPRINTQLSFALK
jgi:hypothetical protein